MPTILHATARLRPPAAIMGQSAILHMAYAGQDLGPLTGSLVSRALSPMPDPGAVMDLATVLLSRGGLWATEGMALLRQTVAVQQSYQISHGNGLGLRILALVTPGDFMANTPLDFLLNGSDAVLILHYVDEFTQDLDLPPHDVAFMAIGESAANGPVLANLARLLAQHSGPILNNDPALIARLTRDQVSEMLADEPSILCPHTRRMTRSDLAQARHNYPILLRPIGSHAGLGLERVSGPLDLAQWLADHPEDAAYASPFIDYRGADGMFTKQRVVLIGGRPYPSHLAASEHWMVHYLNADMAQHEDRRAAEAIWMDTFERDFAPRHAQAFAAMYRLFGLDYFAIDCAEAPDGRLLVFEVDTAMIVHDMDDEATFPYKKPAMKRLFGAFLTALSEAAEIG